MYTENLLGCPVCVVYLVGPLVSSSLLFNTSVHNILGVPDLIRDLAQCCSDNHDFQTYHVIKLHQIEELCMLL